MKHKLLSVLLALAMALTMLPASALAAGTGGTGDVAQIGESKYATIQAAIDSITDSIFTYDGTASNAAIGNRYGAGTNSAGKMTISGGTFTATNGLAVSSWKGGENKSDAEGKLTITGGTFSSDPFADGTGVTSDTHVATETDGKWVVGPKPVESPVTVQFVLPNGVTVTEPGNMTQDAESGKYNVTDKSQSVSFKLAGVSQDKKAVVKMADSELTADNGTYTIQIPAETAEITVTVTLADVAVTPTLAFGEIPSGTVTDDKIFGMEIAKMGAYTFEQKGKDVTVTGAANYLEDYTGFNGTDTAEQQGHYLPIQIKGTEGTTIVVKGTNEKSLTFGNDGSFELVMYLDKLTDSTFTVTTGSDTYTVDCSKVVMMAKPETGTTVEVKVDEPTAGETAPTVTTTVKTDSGEEIVSAKVPTDLTIGDDETAVGDVQLVVKSAKADAVTNTELKASNGTALPTSSPVVEAIKNENTKIVEVKFVNPTTDEEVSAESFGSGAKITITINGLTPDTTYYVFSVANDGTVSSYGYKKTGTNETSLTVNTGHLTLIGASPIAEDAVDGFKDAVSNAGTKEEPAGSVEGGEDVTLPESTKVEAKWARAAETEADFYGGKLELKGLSAGKTYLVRLDVGTKVGGKVPTACYVIKNTATATLSCQGAANLIVFEIKDGMLNSEWTEANPGYSNIYFASVVGNEMVGTSVISLSDWTEG